MLGRLFAILAAIELLLAAHSAIADRICIADIRAADAAGQQKYQADCSHCLATRLAAYAPLSPLAASPELRKINLAVGFRAGFLRAMAEPRPAAGYCRADRMAAGSARRRRDHIVIA
jgi:hypothetical protein